LLQSRLSTQPEWTPGRRRTRAPWTRLRERHEGSRSRKLENGARQLRAVASRDPNNADAQNYLGYAWRKSGNLDLAFKHYNEALRLDPKHRERTSTSAKPI